MTLEDHSKYTREDAHTSSTMFNFVVLFLFSLQQKGYFDVLVKSSYEDDVASQLENIPDGGFVSAKGPFAYDYFKYEANMRDTIHMIAGGSGISVMLQVYC